MASTHSPMPQDRYYHTVLKKIKQNHKDVPDKDIKII